MNILYVNSLEANNKELEQQLAENEKRYDKFDRMHKEASRQLVEERDELRQQLAERNKQVTLLRSLVPKRIPNGFVSFGKYYSEQEDKFNNPYNQMCKFKRKYLSDCEEALAATADLKDVILCEKAPIGSVSLVVAPDVYWGGKLYEANPSSYLGAAFYKSVIHGEPLYRAWEPKK